VQQVWLCQWKGCPHQEAHFGLFGDSANLDIDSCMVLPNIPYAQKIFLDAPNGTPRFTRLNWKLILVCLVIVLNLTRDRWTVCTERTLGSKIVLDTQDRTPR
jgi:hypothetical protein